MSEPFLAEIRMVGFNFAPRGWALCDGQIVPIEQNQRLFSLLGTTYGGDGRATFALPDLRGRTPIHSSGRYPQGQIGGAETHILSDDEVPNHTHDLYAQNSDATQDEPQSNVLSRSLQSSYADFNAARQDTMAAEVIGNVGGDLPHNNMQPFLTVNFCIALQGLFPSRN